LFKIYNLSLKRRRYSEIIGKAKAIIYYVTCHSSLNSLR